MTDFSQLSDKLKEVADRLSSQGIWTDPQASEFEAYQNFLRVWDAVERGDNITLSALSGGYGYGEDCYFIGTEFDAHSVGSIGEVHITATDFSRDCILDFQDSDSTSITYYWTDGTDYVELYFSAGLIRCSYSVDGVIPYIAEHTPDSKPDMFDKLDFGFSFDWYDISVTWDGADCDFGIPEPSINDNAFIPPEQIDTNTLVNKDHQFLDGLISWNVALPHTSGGNFLYDISGHQNHGAVSTGAKWTGRESGYGAIDTQSVGVVNLPSIATSLAGSSEFTISFWAAKFGGGSGGLPAAVTIRPNPTNASKSLIIYPFGSANGQVYFNGTTQLINVTGTARDGRWNHFCFVSRSSTDHRFFVNGIEIGSSSTSKSIDADVTNFEWGLYPAQTLGGLLDNLMIYNRGLSDAEIVGLYRQPYSPLNRLSFNSSQVHFFSETGEGGVEVGGESNNTKIVIATTDGGILAGGESVNAKIVMLSSTGGIIAGGAAIVSGMTFDEVAVGGIEAGGTSISAKIVFETSSDGVEAGGESNSWTEISIGKGSLLTGGSADINSSTSIIASGGAVICQPYFSNGFLYRTTLTIPASNLTENLQSYYAGVIVDLPSEAPLDSTFLVTDTSGNVKDHEVRDFDGLSGWLFFRADLSAKEDNEFHIYSGGSP